MSYPPNYQTHQFPVATPEDSDVVRIERGPDSFQATVAGIKGGGASLPIGLTGANTFTAVGATAGDYTLAKSGIVVNNDNGDEVFRIWGTDPDYQNDGSVNLYIGHQAGLNQTVTNPGAGYNNVGIGASALLVNTSGANNTAIAGSALERNVSGTLNTAIGYGALFYTETGTKNVGVGYNANSAADSANTIALGANATVTGSNKAVIGDVNLTDAYFGSETAVANTRQARVFIVGNTAPADGALSANQVAIWFDPTNGAAKLMFKAKQADGTVKTGSVNVQT